MSDATPEHAEPKPEAAKEGILSRITLPKSFGEAGNMVKENFASSTHWSEKLGRGVGTVAGATLAGKGISDMLSKDAEGNRHVFKGAVETGLGAVVAGGSLLAQIKKGGAGAAIA